MTECVLVSVAISATAIYFISICWYTNDALFVCFGGLSLADVLYVHKQRLVAIEELKKFKYENKSLLQEKQVLGMERQGAVNFFVLPRKSK
jgi:hypothetical protein